MGGTNNFFQQLLADASGVSFDDVDPKEAHMLTDKAAFIIAQKIIEQIKKSCGERSLILPVRAGGDELRIMVTDVDPKELKRMRARIHHSIELSMAALGLHDHPHAKAPDNPVKRGFGAAVCVMDMRDADPAFYAEQADAKIEVEKRILGAYRLGRLPPQDIMLKMVFDKVVPYYDGREPIQEVLGREAETRYGGAYQRLKKAHGTCQLQGRSSLDLLRNICQQMDEQITQLDLSDEVYSDPLSIWDNHDRSFANSKTFYQSIKQRNFVKLTSILNDLEVDTDVYELAYLIMSMSDLSPEDPAAQVHMPRDLPETLELYLDDLERHKEVLADAVHNENDEGVKVQSALSEAGMDFQDLEGLSPMLLGVSMHNLAGLNKLLGHENADKALKFIAHDVMKKALMDHGMGDDDYFLAHYGGGEFVALIEPVIQKNDGTLLIPSEALMETVRADINAKMKALNDMDISAFL
jgi:GGDEF domain-containing protein